MPGRSRRALFNLHLLSDDSGGPLPLAMRRRRVTINDYRGPSFIRSKQLWINFFRCGDIRLYTFCHMLSTVKGVMNHEIN